MSFLGSLAISRKSVSMLFFKNLVLPITLTITILYLFLPSRPGSTSRTAVRNGATAAPAGAPLRSVHPVHWGPPGGRPVHDTLAQNPNGDARNLAQPGPEPAARPLARQEGPRQAGSRRGRDLAAARFPHEGRHPVRSVLSPDDGLVSWGQSFDGESELARSLLSH